LSDLLGPYGYQVKPVEVRGCLHLKSACCHVGNDTVLVNRSWIDVEPLAGYELLDVPEEEPAAANALLLNDVVIMPASFPKTRALLESRGFSVRAIDVSELQKAEAGVTCTSLIFSDETKRKLHSKCRRHGGIKPGAQQREAPGWPTGPMPKPVLG